MVSACAAIAKLKRKTNTQPSRERIRMGLVPALISEKPMRSFISTLMVASRLY
jgi:hypothetical protein